MAELSTLERLRAARDAVAAGWCKGRFHQEGPSGGSEFCVLGALGAPTVHKWSIKWDNPGNGSHLNEQYFDLIYRTHFDPENPVHRAVMALMEVFEGGAQAGFYNPSALANFNNNSATQDDILALLDAAIEKQERCAAHKEVGSA